MISRLGFLYLLLHSLLATAQDAPPDRLYLGVHLSQSQASLGVPGFSPLEPGLGVSLDYQWNQSNKHQWVQSNNLQYFNHPMVQQAVQLYSEIGYHWQTQNGFRFNFLSIGGGYWLSMLNLPSLDWNETTQTYEVNPLAIRNNWMISLGAGLAYRSPLQLAGKPLTFYARYRLQVQGIFIRQSVPVIAYVPLMLGVQLPIFFSK